MKEKLKSLRFKIIALIMCFSFVIALIVASLSFYLSRKYLTETQRQSSYINLQLIGNEINSDLNTALGFTNYLLLDSDTENYLKQIQAFESEDSGEYKKISMDTWKHLNDEYVMSASHDFITRFVVSVPDGSRFLHIAGIPGFGSVLISNSIMQLPGFDDMLQSPKNMYVGFVQSPINTSSANPVIPIVRSVKSSSSPNIIGWIYAEISSDAVTSHIDNLDLPKDSKLYITFGNNITYTYENKRFIESSLPEDLTYYDLPDKPIRISLLPSASELKKRSISQFAVLLLIPVFILLFGAIVYALLRSMISVPVDALLSKLQKVGGGDFTRDKSIEWDNELGQIGKGINDLSDNVDALIGSKLEDERAKQALEYRILQSQVNPHFMYNTLNTIKWMATIQGADGIADMSTSLSRLLKNVAKVEDNLIPLKDEIALLDDYYTIMKYRYGGTIELEYDIKDDALLFCMVNRFCLQPIVENAIFHGIEPKGSAGKIKIDIYEKDSLLNIDVTDNGIGMDEDTIARMMSGNENAANDFFKDVGFSNVNSRIKFAFGDEYGLNVESVPGKYTTVHFVLPKTTGEDYERKIQDSDSGR